MMQGLCISCSISEVEQLRKNSSWGSTPETAGWISVISAQLLEKGDWNVRRFSSMQSFEYFRWCGSGAWAPPVIRLTSSSNVMLLTISLDRREERNILKAHFQAIPKISK